MKPASILAALTLALTPGPAGAASSAWQDIGGGRVRLLAQLDPASRNIDAVVEIELKAGWKTYWREPGASGVPPQFDFSRSQGVRADAPAFPPPELIRLEGVEFAGYRDRVRFPFRATAADGGAGLLALDLIAGVCEKICIPATASFGIEVAAMQVSDPIAAKAVSEARRALPGPASPDFGLAATKIGPDAIEIVAHIAADGAEPNLFVEGPAEWRLTPARLLSRDGGVARFRVDLGAVPPDSDVAAARLRATLVQGGRGAEQEFVPSR